jgi:hypothetical protein
MKHLNSNSENLTQTDKISQIMQIIAKLEPSFGMEDERMGLILPYSGDDMRLRKTWHKPRKTLKLG